MIQSKSSHNRHQLVLLCAFVIGLTQSFIVVPSNNKVSPKKRWCQHRSIYNNNYLAFSFLRLADDDSSLQEQAVSATETASTSTSTITIPQYQGTFTESPELVFHQLAVTCSNNKDSSSPLVVGVKELKQWGELQDLLSDEDITQTELEEMYTTSRNTNNDDTGIIIKNENGKCDDVDDKLDKDGFIILYNMIDDLFDYDGDDDDGDTTVKEELINNVGVNDNDNDNNNDFSAGVDEPNIEDKLLSFLQTDIIVSVGGTVDKDKMPCGMECTDNEREIILKMVSELKEASDNLVVLKNGNIEAKDLIGDWDLLYTSSKAMILNKSISGLTGTLSQKVEFSGVRQKLTGSKYLGFVEYIETFNVGTEEAFDVEITGEWLLREDQPTTLQVDPENIQYGSSYAMTEQAPVVAIGGGVSQVASWQSLGPIKLLDIIYLTPNLYIARGKSKMDAIFVWMKVNR
mmetsp:Transcript_11709/g.13440  ORF Transcript_11709/g.13440 Transcript_11709/m.13440 type:complete len:459 (-) Transcript_11709:95-1471(-)